MVRKSLRQLIGNPGFACAALITLALGIGASSTAFTVLDRLLLQSRPFRDPQRIVQIWAATPRAPMMSQSPGDYLDEREQNTVFDDAAVYVLGAPWSLAEPGQPAMGCGALAVNSSFFRVFGVQPEQGRAFTLEEEKRHDQLTLIGNAFWREHFGADPKIIGRTVRLNAKVYTITGVLPPAFDDPLLFGVRPDFMPLDPTDINRGLRSQSWYMVAARLKTGVSLRQAQAEMKVLAQRMAHDNPGTNTGRSLSVTPFPTNAIGDDGARLTWLVLALSGMVLLIACANLANLQLVRVTRRAREMGIRLALGCSRAQLVGMVLTESLVLSVAGGALGLAVAKWSNSFVASFLGLNMPIDYRVLGFTFGASVVTGAAFGAVPAWMASRTDVNLALKSSGPGASTDRTRRWLRQTLVVIEVGLALTLLAGAGFFVSGLYRLTHRDLGWNPEHQIVGFLALDHDHYGEHGDPRSVVFSDRMRETLRALPGVLAAAVSDNSPAWGSASEPFRIEGQPPPDPGREPVAAKFNVSPGFLDVYGIRLREGRDFQDTDRLGAPPVVIVSESLAQKFWPGENPIGKRIGRANPSNPNWAEVIGVMADFHTGADAFNMMATNYRFLRPWAQNSHRFITFNVLVAGDPAATKDSVRKALGLLAPDVATSTIATVPEVLDGQVRYFAFLRQVLVQISVLGLVLAAVGIYGVVANLATERTKEIGIRMALGANPRGLVWLFLRNGFALAMTGTALGLVAAYFLVSFLARTLPVLPGRDPWIVLVDAAVLVVVALVACWLPARRTARVNPIIALRAE